jgi:hypothetical protein
MGINEAGHEEFPFLQFNERGTRDGMTVLCDDVLKLGALYILVYVVDVTIWRDENQTFGKSKVVFE